MEIIEGYVEGIRFKSEETGYVVCKISFDKNSIIAVGIVPFLKEGQHVKITGEWVTHKQFGDQFNIKKCEEIMPTTIKGMEQYLSSGVIKGIGPVTAKKIINQFGEDTFKVLDNNIEKLKFVEGIGSKKFEIIKESYSQQNELKDIIIYLQEFGFTQGQCIKVYKTFGADAVNVIKTDPYLLCTEIKGIGFLSADKIAAIVGIDKNDPSRIKSGIKFVINRFCSYGNTYMPEKNVISETGSLLKVDSEEIEKNIYSLVVDKEIIAEKLSDDNRIFIPIFYYCEIGITEKIAKLSIQSYQNINIDIDFEIDKFERNQSINFADFQREAITGAFLNGIEIITGGPGTGKTTIIKCIIDIYEKEGMKVLLAAPTGRAAKRMTESTGREAKTIHRLLDIGAYDDETYYSSVDTEPLEADVVIIDEASMIDIFLMQSLLKSIKLGTRLIIVGDVDQLPSVGPGNVLSDLIKSNSIKTVRLDQIFRQGKESLIVTNAHKINKGEMPVLNQKDKDFFFQRQDDSQKILQIIIDLVNRRIPGFNKNIDKIKDIQVLSPMKKGILGVLSLNEKLQQVLNPPDKSKNEKKQRNTLFREGDKVMQTKNNYSIKWEYIIESDKPDGEGVFNGDMGFIESIDNEEKIITVIFDEEKRVRYSPENIEELELAYAITIHKSQGSEFKVVIMPMYMGSPFLMNRNLIYTGITRAKELVTVVGKLSAMKYMIDNTNNMERYSTLEYRIKDLFTSDM